MANRQSRMNHLPYFLPVNDLAVQALYYSRGRSANFMPPGVVMGFPAAGGVAVGYPANYFYYYYAYGFPPYVYYLWPCPSHLVHVGTGVFLPAPRRRVRTRRGGRRRREQQISWRRHFN